MKRLVVTVFALAVSVSAPVAHAWGRDGHNAVGEIASCFLTPEAEREVARLLAHGPYDELSTVGYWADSHARQYRTFDWAIRLHFINVDPETLTIDMASQCPGGECVIGAIRRFVLLAADRSLPIWDRAEHFRFLVHFIEDIHQPVHVVHPDGMGGNQTPVELLGYETNLHSVWDSGLIYNRLREYRDRPGDVEPWRLWAYEQRMAITPEDVAAWTSSLDPEDWAREVIEPARALTFHVRSGQALGEDYLEATLPTLELQIRKAGVRLAAVLNEAFAVAADQAE